MTRIMGLSGKDCANLVILWLTLLLLGRISLISWLYPRQIEQSSWYGGMGGVSIMGVEVEQKDYLAPFEKFLGSEND